MYLKIELSSELMSELSDRIDVDNSFVRDCESGYPKCRGKLQFAYDVYCHIDKVTFTVLLTFLSHGSAFSYCFCGLSENKRCIHIEEALLFHQERCRFELEKFFGKDVIDEEMVF